MPKRHVRRGLRDRLIELLEQRLLLSANVQLVAVAPVVQAVATTGSIFGYVTNDLDHLILDDFDAAQIVGRGIKGVTVFIDANGNGRLDGATASKPAELHTRTNGAGEYVFRGLSPGTYRVREIVPEGLWLFSPAFSEAVVTAGSQTYVETFQNTDCAVIDGGSGADRILIEPHSGGLRVTINGRARQIRKAAAGLLVRSGSGTDHVSISSRITLTTRIEGGDGADTLTGGGGTNLILGGQGNDVINGGATADTLDGGDGDDVVSGGEGDDSLTGGLGNDVMNGDGGNDRIDGSEGNDALNGGAGNDYLATLAGDDSISGGDGNDSIYARYAGGKAVLTGDAGDDTFSVNDSVIVVDGGTGSDEVTYFGKRMPRKTQHIEHYGKYVPSPPPKDPWPHCFLTTAVVAWAGKRDDCEELTLLRRFRDTYMRRLPDGPDMIRDYYAHAPRVVGAIETARLGDVEWPKVYRMVSAAVRQIRAGRNAEALAIYAAEYLRLKTRYCPSSPRGEQ